MEKEFYTEEFGFYPNTDQKTIVKHLSGVIANKKLEEIEGYGNLLIAMQIPVWPKTINGRELNYFETQKPGHFQCREKDNIILNDNIKMEYNNLPVHESLSTNDFETLPLQFLCISAADKKLEGKIIFLKPSTKGLMRFKYKEEILTAIFEGSILFTKEV